MTSRRSCPICTLRHATGQPSCVDRSERWPADQLIAAVGSALEVGRRLGWASTKGGITGQLLTDLTADRWAVACGLHPEQVWPGWCDAGLTVGDRQAIEGGGWRPAWEWGERERVSAEGRAA